MMSERTSSTSTKCAGEGGGDGCLRNLLANKEIKLLKSPLLSGGDTNMTDSYLTNGDTQVVLTSGHWTLQSPGGDTVQ